MSAFYYLPSPPPFAAHRYVCGLSREVGLDWMPAPCLVEFVSPDATISIFPLRCMVKLVSSVRPNLLGSLT